MFVVKICNVCLKRPKINEKEAGVGPFLKKMTLRLSEAIGAVTGLTLGQYEVRSAWCKYLVSNFRDMRPDVPSPSVA